MQIKSPLFVVSTIFFLSSCNQNSIEEEKFEISFDEYPKIVSVPDRPKIPSNQEIETIQKQLSTARQQAYEAAKITPQP